jgi:hypothetical protein
MSDAGDGLTDTLSTTASNIVPGNLTGVKDPVTSATYSMAGYEVTSVPFPVTMTCTASGGLGRLFTVIDNSWASTYTANGNIYTDSWIYNPTPYSAYSRADYNAVNSPVTPVPIDSRTVYGQPDLAGEYSADPNAPPRNVNFNGWIYGGGIFAGNSPTGTTDLSGTARTQFYVGSSVPTSNVVWEDLVLCYFGYAGTYNGDPSYSLYEPSSNDSNYLTPSSSTTWATAWSKPNASLLATVPLTGYSWPSYANFQVPEPQTGPQTLISKFFLALTNESGDITNNVGDWRYFTTAGFASALGSPSLSVAQATPHVWVLYLPTFETGTLP